ncbi:TetR/AcrR family transcriptional regulator [Caryophanon latum]|uniref:HTH tetR-type domain-containing protein n=1 Tax=Caryophanon latum TaxID=33977 RepID=A0A1C0YHU4_9BACL|nr:TetR/AcrR family transcriptional regulator [Caryophanon latum]OCS86689.1 hypothetical protein A6K76_14365 [Caryophanon latum]
MLKKQLIIQSALELFASQGIEATSVQQITERAGISKGAFYLSFKSKDELILAMIHHFMTNLITSIDSMVTKANANDDLLYQYLFHIYTCFTEHASFAKVLMTDVPHTINQSLLEHVTHYDHIITSKVQLIVKKQFPTLAQNMVDETVFFIRGLVGSYGTLFFHSHTHPESLHTLCTALVEKITIHAQHATIAIIQPNMLFSSTTLGISKEQTIDMLQQAVGELQDDLLRNTTTLLIEQLQTPTLCTTLLDGLISTMSLHAETKTFVPLLREHFAHRVGGSD